MSSIGSVLKQARIRAQLSQDSIARRAGMTAAQLSQIELGRSASPEFATVARIAPLVGVTLDEIAAACGFAGFDARRIPANKNADLVLARVIQELRSIRSFNQKARDLADELTAVVAQALEAGPKQKRTHRQQR